DGGSWYARLERRHGQPDPHEVMYLKVIAWESSASDLPEGGPQLFAWLNGTPPVRSDKLAEYHLTSYILNGYTQELPTGATVSAWS
ncbi:MAG TPA: hypothetical protein VFE45_09215, partial [Coriobacteriia bacterium]|nr:hypothetical protein [Coriobacteriia bacterium]